MSYIEKQIERLKNEKYHSAEPEGFRADALRLQNGEPYEYVLGHVDFLGAHIDLSLRPMIPRPETAFWVARAIEELRAKGGPLRIADTFSGAGNVGLALLKHLPNATVEFFELDPKLKAQIEMSIERNGIDRARAKVITASALDGLEKDREPSDLNAVRGASEAHDQDVHTRTTRGTNERDDKEMRQVCGLYDAIFAVPPYVPYEALPDLDKEMIDHEPHLAFFAHDNGHEFHTILIEKGRDFLKEGGTLYMETDIDHNDWVREKVNNTAWNKLEFWPDPYGATPNVVLRK